jgi:hypothetical protein
MNTLIKKKEKSSKKERKNDNSKDKILGVITRYAPSILSLLKGNISAIFCKLFLGRDRVNMKVLTINY